MKCPRCSANTKVLEQSSIKVDVCYDSCGGIWFDWLELKKMDENHEVDPQFIETLARSSQKNLDLAQRINCPVCENQPMVRRFSSVKRKVEVDECPKCGGMWLDAGELTHLHSEFKTDADRQKAVEAYINDTFSQAMAIEKAKGQEALDTAKKFATALRFICPSYYIPGKQKGGAF